jgi:hypothetical protein
MRLLLTSLLLTASMLVACSEKPQNYSCAFIDSPKIINSLSIKNGGAILNTQTFEVMCKKVGNMAVYGATKNDCESYRNGANYNVLIFDEVIHKASTLLQGSGALITEQYVCNPITQ